MEKASHLWVTCRSAAQPPGEQILPNVHHELPKLPHMATGSCYVSSAATDRSLALLPF